MKTNKKKGNIHRLMDGGNGLLLSSIASSIASSGNMLRRATTNSKPKPKEIKPKMTSGAVQNIVAAAAAGAAKTEKKESETEIERASPSTKSTVSNLKDSIQESINKMNSCNKEETQSTQSAFNEWLEDIFKTDPKSNDINTHLIFYTTKNPNNRGTHISDFDIIVENEELPFTNLDRVDYFLSNYVKMIENERLKDDDPAKVDRSMFFNKIKKSFPHYSSKVARGGKKTRHYRKRASGTRKKK